MDTQRILYIYIFQYKYELIIYKELIQNRLWTLPVFLYITSEKQMNANNVSVQCIIIACYDNFALNLRTQWRKRRQTHVSPHTTDSLHSIFSGYTFSSCHRLLQQLMQSWSSWFMIFFNKPAVTASESPRRERTGFLSFDKVVENNESFSWNTRFKLAESLITVQLFFSI